MLAEYLKEGGVRLNVSCGDWKEAVKAGTDLLLRQGAVENAYLDAIIRHHEEMGPYMVVAPGLMLAHARPEEGVKKMGLSLVTLKEPVVFGSETNDPVKLVITLATTDNQAHLALLEELMELLSNERDMQRIHAASDLQEIAAVLDSYGGPEK